MINTKRSSVIFYIIIFLISCFVCKYSFCSPKQTIYIYFDKGVSTHSFFQLAIALKESSNDQFNIKAISASQVIDQKWRNDAFLFVMPGGAAIDYKRTLGKNGNKEIIAFIKNGGRYLGICGGAYYATGYEFDKGGNLEAFDKGLDLLPIKTVGPIYPYSSTNNSGARSVKILYSPDFYNIDFNAYYNGGGYFDMKTYKGKDIKIIGSYEQNLPAIIYSKYGKGQVILSSVHLESNPYFMSKSDPYFAKIIDSLIKDNENRMKLLGIMFKYLAP